MLETDTLGSMVRNCLWATALLLLVACGSPDETSRDSASDRAEKAPRTKSREAPLTIHDPAAADRKIDFDLDAIDDDGLVGPPDGRRAVSYEFCVPRAPARVAEVKQIDSTLQVHGDSPGRVGCSASEILCIGHTRQPRFRQVLRRLASFSYVKEIQESHFE